MKRNILVTLGLIFLIQSISFAKSDDWLVKRKYEKQDVEVFRINKGGHFDRYNKGEKVHHKEDDVKHDGKHKEDDKGRRQGGHGSDDNDDQEEDSDSINDSINNPYSYSWDNPSITDIEQEWTVTDFPLPSRFDRPVIVQRVADRNYGTKWDKMSDDTYNVFYNYESGVNKGKLAVVVNTERDIQYQFIYNTIGNFKDVIDYTDKSIDTYNEGGKPGSYIYKNRQGNIIKGQFTYHDDGTYTYERSMATSQAEQDKYNKYL